VIIFVGSEMEYEKAKETLDSRKRLSTFIFQPESFELRIFIFHIEYCDSRGHHLLVNLHAQIEIL
jgi:hypothetical protein